MLDQNEKKDKIRSLATDFYKKERAAVLKNSAAKKMKAVFNNNPDVFVQDNGWMDSFAMDRFGDEVYVATLIDAIEQKFINEPSYQLDIDAIFAKMDNPSDDLKEIFIERLSSSNVFGAADAGRKIVEERAKAEEEKAENDAREKRISHMAKQAEFIQRAETLTKAGNFEEGEKVLVSDYQGVFDDKIFNREIALWMSLYKRSNPSADEKTVEGVCDRLLCRFAKNYFKSENAEKDLAKIPEEERKNWISRLHENSLYLFGQIAKNGSDTDRLELSKARYYQSLSAELYRRYPEYEAETLAEMPVTIWFIRGSASELVEDASGYRYNMKDNRSFIVPSDIVRQASEFSGYIVSGTRGWVRSYVLYAVDGSQPVSLSDVEADSVLANEKFYKDIVALFSR